MTDTEPSCDIKEKHYLKGKVGEPLELVLPGEKNVPPPGPGSVQLTGYDSRYLKIDTCGWFPAGELLGDSSVFQISFTPLEAGETDVNFSLRPRAINPLYMPITFVVTISK